MTYTLAAVADAVFLVAGWLFIRRFSNLQAGRMWYVAIAITPFMFVGIVYLILILAVVGPSCPNGRWAC